MKTKLLFSIIALFLGLQYAHGQAALLVLIFGDKVASENFYFSIKGGINYSDLSGLDDFDYKPGVHFGLSNNIRINDRWYFVPEFLPLSHKGAIKPNLSFSGEPVLDSLAIDDISMTAALNYIDIPLLFRYKISKKINLEFGPQISFLTSAKNRYNAELSNGDAFEYLTDRKVDYKNINYGFQIAMGYVISKADQSVMMEVYLRYNEGLSNISKIENQNIHNRVLQLSVSFPFLLEE